MDSNEKIQDNKPVEEGMDLGVDMPLFLMSQFCDTALRQLSHKNQITGQDELPSKIFINPSCSGSSPLFTDVDPYNLSNITYRPKKRRKGHSSRPKPLMKDSFTSTLDNVSSDVPYCGDLFEPDSQMLVIQRKPTLSNHIKSLPMSEFFNHAAEESGQSKNDTLFEESDTESEIVVLETKKRTTVNGCISNTKDRLESYLPILKSRIESGKWSGVKVAQLGDNIDDTDEISVFYGVLSKPNSVKSTKLGKLFDNVGVTSLPLQSMTSRKRQLFLQDETGQIALNDLTNELKFDEIISGIVIAAVGKVKKNCLQVEDVIFPTPCPPQWPMQRENNIEMVFVSGLLMGNTQGFSVSLDLLQDYLLGLSGTAYEQKEVMSKRCRLFIVGNSISNFKKGKRRSNSVDEIVKKRDCSMDMLDEFLRPFLDTMEVFIIPGENDPSFTPSFPQPPLHSKLLHESGRHPSLKRLTNPARIQVSITDSSDDNLINQSSNCSLINSSVGEFLREDVSFIDVLLQSGRNLKESMDYCDISCPIEMGLKLLKWGHLHPNYSCDSDKRSTAEDTFRLHGSLPHLAVIGNLTEFKVVNWNNTKLIGIPSFHKSHTAVVLTRDFDVIPLSFKMA